MKICFAYIPYMFRWTEYFEKGKKFNFPNLYKHPSGLTGSELSCITIARVMASRGHDVSLLTTVDEDNYVERWQDIRIIPMRSLQDIGVLGGDFDVVYSWNEIEALRYALNPKTLKMLNLQINDVNHGEEGFDNNIDVYTSPSESHRQTIGTRTPDFSKWEVVPNGCDPSMYTCLSETVSKVKGRVIYASSPDRGLHWLLRCWPQIKQAVPHAHLKIFYEIKKWMDPLLEAPPINRDISVLSHRARYIKEALHRLRNHDIEIVGSVSRNDIAREFCKAEVLAYPCDTINYTEGFSVTLMEACASKTVPVTTNVDALGEIYGNSVPMVEMPICQNLTKFSDLVIKSLTNDIFRHKTLLKTSTLADQHDWQKITDKVEEIIRRRLS